MRKTREGAKIALTSGLAAKNQGNCDVGSSSCQSTRSCDVTAKNDEGQREKRPEIIEKLIRKSFANELRQKNHDFSLPTRLGIDFAWLGALQGAPGRWLWAPGAPLGAPGAPRRRPKTLPRRPEIASGMLLGATGRPGRLPRSIFGRFVMPRSFSRDVFWIDLALPRLTCLDVGCPGRSTCHRSGLLEFAWLSSKKPND